MSCSGEIYQRVLSCRHCHRTLHRHGPDEPWVDSVQTMGGDNPECPEAPGSDEAMQPHQPGTVVVTNPEWKGRRPVTSPVPDPVHHHDVFSRIEASTRED